ncbi:MAG: hypothetical protein Q9208_001026 [Pyrenodesmia sp. 3 TL-2023]
MDSPRRWRPQAMVYRPGPYTAEATGAPKVDGETIPRRALAAKDGLIKVPEDGVETVYDILRHSAKKYGHANALGSRKLIRTHEETKKVKKVVEGKEETIDKKWTYFEMSEYHYMSFLEYEQLALQCGAGLRKLGMNKDDRLHIFAATTPYWLAMAHGAATQSMPIVTAYDTLGEEGLQHSLCQTHAKAIFLEPSLIPKLTKPLQHAKDIQVVIYNSAAEVNQSDIDSLKQEHPNLTVLSFNELQSLGQSQPVDPVPPKPEDLCFAGADTIVGKYLGPGDKLITYLPLAHIFEFMFENASIFWGCTMGYGSAKTLTDTSVRNCKGDIREFAPTVMVGVPSVWELVKKGIIRQIKASNPIVRNMFRAALSVKKALLSAGLPGAGVLDYLVFRKIKAATGGQLRISMNGGGPIAQDTQRFISMCITPMINGYGLTETCAMGAICDPANWTSTALGQPPGSIEIKLVDCPSLSYLSSHTPNPQGEIWIRGPAVTSGYLSLPEENAQSFTPDGWFKTGDIGEFADSDVPPGRQKGYGGGGGLLRVIDRKKNMVKTLNGEYIALEKLESIYRSCALVANICVVAAEDRSKPVAIVVPVEAALKSLASRETIRVQGDDSVQDLAANEKVREAALRAIQEEGRRGGLVGIEIVEGIVFAGEEWTPQNGFVTSAQKVNRRAILKEYQSDVDRAYAAKEPELLKFFVSMLLFLACPVLSSPVLESQNPSLRPRSSFRTAVTNPVKLPLPNAAMHKRSGRPFGPDLTMHAIKVATYIGSRLVLENLYTKILNEASRYGAGEMASFLQVEYGDVKVAFSADPGTPFQWGVIRHFAERMLMRVFAGEQNFYIADIVTPNGILGSQTIHYLMGVPDTVQNVANEPWAATLQQWLESVGIGG